MVTTYLLIIGVFLVGVLFGGLLIYIWRQFTDLVREVAQLKSLAGEMGEKRLSYSQVDGIEHALAKGLQIRRAMHELELYRDCQMKAGESILEEMEELEAVLRLLRQGVHAYKEEKVNSKKRPVKLWD